MKKYSPRKGYRFSEKDAQVIGSFLSEKFPDGNITPREIIEVAKSKRSPIHQYFEWNDTIAAEKYRISQARTMIRAIYVEIEGGKKIEAYHHVYLKEFKKNMYVDADRARHTPDLWEQVIQDALTEAINWRERYKAYNELSPISKAITKTERKLLCRPKRKPKSKKPKKKKQK